ncbi:MAG: sulfur carrier protein ThiS [Kiritimatiellia bacterium]
MTLTINGATTELQDGATVAQLLEKDNHKEYRVAVLVNDNVVKAERRESHVLQDGDRVEIFVFAGGG